MITNRSRVFSNCLLVVFTCGLSFYGQANNPAEAGINVRVQSFEVSGTTVGDALSRLANDYQVPIGFQAIGQSRPKQPELRRISVANGTVRDVLDAITAAAPDYRWQEVDGVINVLPREPQDSLLDVLISTIDFGGQGPDEAVAHLLKAPEVELWFQHNDKRQRSFSTLPGDTRVHTVVQLPPLRNITVRTALNDFVKAGGSKFWSYFEYGEGNQFISLSM
jgi:hypothetical protein